jgi:hypothetical protein
MSGGPVDSLSASLTTASDCRNERVRELLTIVGVRASTPLGSAARSRVIRPAELHHRPLAEPSVRLSPHSAPIRQTCRAAKVIRLRSERPLSSWNIPPFDRVAQAAPGPFRRKPAPSEAISPKHSGSHVLRLKGSAVRLPGQIFAARPPRPRPLP